MFQTDLLSIIRNLDTVFTATEMKLNLNLTSR